LSIFRNTSMSMHRHVGLAAERAGWNALHQHDDAFAIRRDALRRLRPARIGRERIQGRGAGNADQIGAQLFGAAFDEGRVQFSHLDESTCTSPRRTLLRRSGIHFKPKVVWL
jgi:hypothetical protein